MHSGLYMQTSIQVLYICSCIAYRSFVRPSLRVSIPLIEIDTRAHQYISMVESSSHVQCIQYKLCNRKASTSANISSIDLSATICNSNVGKSVDIMADPLVQNVSVMSIILSVLIHLTRHWSKAIDAFTISDLSYHLPFLFPEIPSSTTS